LPYRVWWDGHSASNIDGPIAHAYGIYGWPTTYIIDSEGIIRFVDLRQEDLLKAVRQLVAETLTGEPEKTVRTLAAD
jgi:hypothetical protein